MASADKHEFDNWEVDNSSGNPSSGVRGLGKIAIIGSVLIACIVAIAMLVESDSRSHRRYRVRRHRTRSRPTTRPRTSTFDRVSRAFNRSIARPKDRTRNSELAHAEKVYNEAPTPFSRPKRSIANWLKKIKSRDIEKWLGEFAAATNQSTEDVEPFLDYDKHIDIIKARWRSLSKSGRADLLSRLKVEWNFPFQIHKLRVAKFTRGTRRTYVSAFAFVKSSQGENWRVRFDISRGSKGQWGIADWYLYDWLIRSSERNSEKFARRGDSRILTYRHWRQDIENVEARLATYRRTGQKSLLGEAYSWLLISEKSKIRSMYEPEKLLRNGRAWEELGFYGTALRRYASAAKLGCPGALRYQAVLYDRKSKFEPSAVAARKYRMLLGKGPWVNRMLAKSATGTSYLEALDYEPSLRKALFSWAIRMRRSQEPELVRRIKKTSDPEGMTRWLLHRLIEERQPIARVLLRSLRGDRIEKELLTAQVLLLEGKRSEAIKQFVQTWKSTKDSKRKEEVVRRMAKDTWQWRSPIEVYDNCPDRPLAIRFIFDEFVKAKVAQTSVTSTVWSNLLAKHSANHKQDPAADFLVAKFKVRRSDLAQRTRLLQSALKKCKGPSEPWYSPTRDELMRVLVFAGKSERAIQLLGEKSRQELMAIATRYQHWDELKKLVNVPEDKRSHEIEIYRAELFLAQKKLADCIRILQKIEPSRLNDAYFDLKARYAIATNRDLNPFYYTSRDKAKLFRAFDKHLRRLGNWKELASLALLHEAQTKDKEPDENAYAMKVRLDTLWQRALYSDICRDKDFKKWPPKGVIFLDDRDRDLMAERIVRATLRRKTTSLAKKFATSVANSTGQELPQLLARAARNSESLVKKSLKEGDADQSNVEELSFDEDIGAFMVKKSRRLTTAKPMRIKRTLQSASIHLLLLDVRKAKHATLYKRIRLPKCKQWKRVRSRSFQHMLIETRVGNFVVANSSKPLAIQTDYVAYGDQMLAKRLRDHKSHISISLYGGFSDGDLAVRQLFTIARQLIDASTTVAIVNDRAILLDKQAKAKFPKIRRLAEVDDNQVACQPLRFIDRFVNYEKERQRVKQASRVAIRKRRGPTVYVQLGLAPYSEVGRMRVTRVRYIGGQKIFEGKLDVTLQLRRRLPKDTVMAIRPADVIRVLK